MNLYEKIKNKLVGLTQKNNQGQQTPTVDLAEVLQKYSVIKAVPGNDEYPAFLIVTEKNHPNTIPSGDGGISFIDPDYGTTLNERVSDRFEQTDQEELPFSDEYVKQLRESKSKKPSYGEIGSSSPSPYTGELNKEYNAALMGLKGLETWQKMRFSDGTIAGQLLLIKTPVNAGRWFMRAGSDKKKDKNIAEFTWKALTEYQSITWTQIKQEAMLACDFGYAMMEKVWEERVIDGKTYTILKKLAPRSPLDVKKWKFDDNGGPKSVVMYVRQGGEHSFGMQEVEIPIEKLVVFTYNKEFNNITGRSVMRPMYKHWYFKDQLYKIDAIQKERHGIGIPVIKLPINHTERDVVSAETLGKNLRTNERAHVVLPYGWELEFAELRGQPVDALKSIETHDKAIRESILAGFLDAKSNTKEEDLGLFLKATRFLADSICDAFNMYLIPELVRYNFGTVKDLPKLTVRQIGEQGDLRTISFALRNAVGAGIIRPDDVLEAHVRELFDLPMADIATVRVVKAPQAGQGPQGPLPNATPGGKSPVGQNGQPSDGAVPQSVGSGKENPQANQVGMPRQTPLPPVGVGGKRVGLDKGQS